MSKFKTAFEYPEGKPTPAGSHYQDEYGYVINKKGQKVLKKTGETDLWAKIQEEEEDCKIENIMKRAAQGDMTHFRPDGIYADVSEMPKTMVEAQQQIHALENTWGELPNEIKAKYNHDVGEFVAKSGSDEWLQDMGLIQAEVQMVDMTPTEPQAAALGQIKEGTNEQE